MDEGGAQARYLVIIPTFNERENLPRIVPAVLAVNSAFDVLIVDDNSPDRTGDLADEMGVGNDRVHAIHRQSKEGLGTAYLEGFRWALSRDYALIFEMDADLSHDPGALERLVNATADADVVVGSRYVDGRVNVINWPLSRLIISLFGSWYARTITRLPLRDATGGFNCFRREVLETLDLNRIESNGYSFQIELKFRAWKKGFRLTEVPIVFTERETGESKMSKKIVREAIWRVWRLRWLDLVRKL